MGHFGQPTILHNYDRGCHILHNAGSGWIPSWEGICNRLEPEPDFRLVSPRKSLVQRPEFKNVDQFFLGKCVSPLAAFVQITQTTVRLALDNHVPAGWRQKMLRRVRFRVGHKPLPAILTNARSTTSRLLRNSHQNLLNIAEPVGPGKGGGLISGGLRRACGRRRSGRRASGPVRSPAPFCPVVRFPTPSGRSGFVWSRRNEHQPAPPPGADA